MPTEEGVTALAERIKKGLRHKGVHIVFKDDLSVVYNEESPAIERVMQVNNFAIQYGFNVNVGEDVSLAIFRSIHDHFNISGNS
jgi:hypothetical protein